MTRPTDLRDATIALMDADPGLDFATAEAAALERAADAAIVEFCLDWLRNGEFAPCGKLGALIRARADLEPKPDPVGELVRFAKLALSGPCWGTNIAEHLDKAITAVEAARDEGRGGK